jgi:hypothetical protein
MENNPSRITTKKVRIAFANVFEPVDKLNTGTPKYSACLLIPKDDEEGVDRIQDAIDYVTEEYKKANGGKLPRNFKLPLRDGDEEDEKADNPDFQGHYFMNVSSVRKPTIVDRDMEKIEDAEDFFSGCYCRVALNFFSFDKQGSKGIAVGFSNIQKIKKGPYIGSGASSPEEDFSEPLDDDDFDDDEFA